MNVKHCSVSSYSDLQKLSPKIEIIHLRKFVSKKLLESIFKSCHNIKLILISERIYRKNPSIILSSSVKFKIIERSNGRPNIIDKMLLDLEIKNYIDNYKI